MATFSLVPLTFFGPEESPPDTIKLTHAEQKLKAQLEPIVASELPALLKAALALRRIRNSRLFRTEAATFPLYLAQRYSLSVGAIKEVASSITAIEDLIGDLVLAPPAGAPASTIQPRLGRKPTHLKPFSHGRTGRPRKVAGRIQAHSLA